MKLQLIAGFCMVLSSLATVAQTKKVTPKTKAPAPVVKLDRSKLPAPGPAPVVNIGKYESFELANGLKVFVVQNRKLPIVSFSLSLEFPPIAEKNMAGYVSMAGQLLKTGTTTLSKDQIDEEIDFIGADFSTSSTGFYASSLKKHSEKLLEIVADVVKNPSFPADQFERVKKETLSGLASNKDNPEDIASLVNKVLLYGENHPYGEATTETTVKNITLDQVKNFYNNYYRPNFGYLAIVGDISLEEAQKWTMKYFQAWPKGNLPANNLPGISLPSKTRVVVVDRPEAVQSVIRIGMPIQLKPGAPEGFSAKTMNDILGGGSSARLFDNLREKRAFTYGAYSSLSSDKYVGNFSASASVRNAVTDSAIIEFMNEINRIRDTKPSQMEISKSIASQTGSFVMSLERPSTIAGFAISTAKYGLPIDYYQNYLKTLASVSETEVQTAAQSLLKPDNMTILVVGKAADVAEKLKKFGEVEYYSTDGKKTEPNLLKPAPAGLTAEKVLENYVAKIGGKDKLLKIKDISTELSASIQGTQLSGIVLRKAPNLYSMTISMGGNVMGQTVSDGKNYVTKQMGQKKEISEAEKAQRLLDQHLWIETLTAALGIKSKLLGIEKINEQEAYKLEFALPNGSLFFEHYSVETGLKIRKTDIRESPNGPQTVPVDFADYKPVNGILMPHKLTQKMGPQTLVFEVKSIKFNSKLKDGLFKVE